MAKQKQTTWTKTSIAIVVVMVAFTVGVFFLPNDKPLTRNQDILTSENIVAYLNMKGAHLTPDAQLQKEAKSASEDGVSPPGAIAEIDTNLNVDYYSTKALVDGWLGNKEKRAYLLNARHVGAWVTYSDRIADSSDKPVAFVVVIAI